MKNLFYKWYGFFLALVIQLLFIYVYEKLEIETYDYKAIVAFVIIYQGIFIIATINYVKLYKAYLEFQEMREKQREGNDKIDK